MKKTTKKPAKRKAKTLVIDRKRWLRGEGSGGNSYLFRDSDKKMCCLGFLGRAIGASIDDLRCVGCPSSASELGWPRWLVSKNDDTNTGENLMAMNDSNESTDSDREAFIAKTFAKHGWKVTFK